MTEPVGQRANSLADAITDTISTWLADHGGGMVSAFALTVNYLDEEGEGSWATCHLDRQTPATTLGLLRWNTLYVEHGLNAYFTDREEGN